MTARHERAAGHAPLPAGGGQVRVWRRKKTGPPTRAARLVMQRSGGLQGQAQTTSNRPAAPMPPPMHIDTTA